MRKILRLSVLCLFILSPLLLPAQGLISVTKKLSVIQTEYFDFIFPEESEPTARHLAQQADNIYRKVMDLLSIESVMRFPVIITPETDVLNAYFSPLPYGRIVMYDAVPTESLAVFSDNLLSVFYHEVVHALSLNIKSPFLNKAAENILSPAMVLNMPPSFIEGTAVFLESLDGEGRLNSAASLHMIKQAKIEGKFPDWRDIAGAYQLYTDGSLQYIFGGAFSNYLYQEYGMEKFAEFWNQCSHLNITAYAGVFEKVYALSLDEVWQGFEDSIYIPPLRSPAQFLFSQESDLWRKTAPGAYLYQNLTASPSGIAWQDGFSGTVRFLPYSVENRNPQTLYGTDLTSRLHFSRDGKYLVSSGLTGGAKAENTVRVYDMEHRKNILVQKDLRDGTVINIPDDAAISLESPFRGVSSVLVGVQTDAAVVSLVLYDMDALQSSGHDVEPLVSIPFERNIVLFEPVDAGNGLLVALMRNFGTWQFFVYDCITGTQRMYAVDEQFTSPSVMSDLYASDTRLYLSYAPTASSQMVLAYVELDDFNSKALTLNVQNEQVSGGVFHPVVISDFTENVQIVHLSRYYEHRALSLLSLETVDSFEIITFSTYIAPKTFEVAQIDYPIQPYRPSQYMNKGMFIPIIGSVNFNSFGDLLPPTFSIGATAFTIDPTERLLIIGGAGMDVRTKHFTSALSTVFRENYFTAAIDVFAATSLTQLETFAAKLYTDIVYPIGSSFNTIKFANSLSWFYLEEKNKYLFAGHTLHDKAELSFSHLRRTGQFFYDVIGFTVGGQAVIRKQFSQNDDINILGALFLGLRTPQLLPFKNPERFTVNLPVNVVGFRYFNSSYTWELQSTIVLFSYDIQESIHFIPLFAQRVTVDAGIDCLWHKQNDPEITVHGSVFMTFALNTGLPTGYPIDLGVEFTWKPYISGINGLDVNLKFALNL